MNKKDRTIQSTISYDDLKSSLIVITGVEEDSDEQLRTAFEVSSNRLYALIADEEVNKKKFEAIMHVALFEMTVYRFNRISEEGMKSTGQKEEHIVWEEDPYKNFEQKIKDTIKSSFEGYEIRYSGSGNGVNRSNPYEYVTPIYSNMDWYYDIKTGRNSYDL